MKSKPIWRLFVYPIPLQDNKLQDLSVANAKKIRERKNKLQAELAARVDMTPEEATRLAG